MTTVPEAADTAAPATPPTPLAQGTFALYELETGALLLSYRTTTDGAPQHLQVPSWIVKMGRDMAARSGGVDPAAPAGAAGILSALMGGNPPS